MENVRVTYAPSHECGPTDMYNPYAPMNFSIEGSIDMVANWIDEHFVTSNCVLTERHYKQGEAVPGIKKALERGGKFSLCNDTFWVTRTFER